MKGDSVSYLWVQVCLFRMQLRIMLILESGDSRFPSKIHDLFSHNG